MGISSSTGIVSGLNYDQIVTQLMQLEQKPITLLQNRQKDYQVKIASFLDISTKLSSFKATLDALNNAESFNTKSASVTKTSSGAELLTVSAANTASTGSYSVQVNQLATASKKAAQGWADQNTTAVAAASGAFKFKVGGGGAETSLSVSATTTLQGLRDAINTANAGVTASILNDGTGSNPYRLVLSANSSGSSNSIYITQNNTNLDFTNKKVEAAYAYTTNAYTGTATSNSGNNYTGTTNKTFLMQMVSTGAVGTAAYKYSVDGGINWLGFGGVAYNSAAANDTAGGAVSTSVALKAVDGSGATNEGVQAGFTAGTVTSGDKFSIDVFNPEMQAAQDAVIKVDNGTITKSTNTITDVIPGVTLNLLKADTASTLTLTVSSSSATAKDNIKKFIEAYNIVNKFINDQSAYDPKIKKAANPLMGDPTLLGIRSKISNAVTGRIPGLPTTDYTNLSQIGITSDSKTGMLSLNDFKLSSALSAKPNAVAKLFIGTATVTNTAVSFVSKTSATQPGSYSLSVATAPQKATLLGGQTIPGGGITLAETLTFVYSSNHKSSLPTNTSFAVALNAGSTVNTIVDNLNSAFATKGVGLAASNENGQVRIQTTSYGADMYFQVASNQGNVANQIGFTSTGSSNSVGVDIAGSINSHVATGLGNVLTGTSGFPEGGLKISLDSNQTGGFGSIAVSSGVSDRLASSVEAYTNATKGILKSKTDSLQKSVDDLTAQQQRIQDRLAAKEKRLRAQFASLETLLSKYNTQGQYLSSQLGSLPTIGGSNRR